MACTECRAAKVKCDKSFPCKRCQRLGRDCIPHESKQGQNPARKKRRHGIEECHKRSGGLLSGTTERVIECALVQSATDQKDHYGLQSIVRQWIAMSIKRRSFQLWCRAGSLAAQCGMNMDHILCETNGQRGMDFLHQIIVTPGDDQKVVGKPLTLAEIPSCLWKAVCLDVAENAYNSTVDVEKAMEHRWVMVRETNKGTTRFYLSPGFERHLVTQELADATFKENKKEVKDLFLAPHSPSSKILMLRGLSQQLTHHHKPGMMPKPVKFSKICILARLDPRSSPQQIETDLIMCVALPNVDQMFILSEFIVPKNCSSAAVVSSEDDGNDGSEGDEDEGPDDLLRDVLLDVDDIGEGEDDFKLIYDLLRDS